MNAVVTLPTSKSESNRWLIIQALAQNKIELRNLSTANDTVLLSSLLHSKEIRKNVQDAGTVMRFLTAYYCAKNEEVILSGNERMNNRPIGPLVDSLNEIGFSVSYMAKQGFPPLHIQPVNFDNLKSEVAIAGNISSQFISALLLIAPSLPKGLTIKFLTELHSKPYIDLTLDCLKKAGIKIMESENKISISHQTFAASTIEMEGDWSAAGYWYAHALAAKESEITFKNLSLKSIQGDKIIHQWLKESFSVKVHEPSSFTIQKITNKIQFPEKLDFTHYPDTAQTMLALAAFHHQAVQITGLQSLRIKETDRVLALQIELKKMGVILHEIGNGVFTLLYDENRSLTETINTYNDHRMAMSMSIFGLQKKICVDNADVVVKSYPHFWKDLEQAGFEIN